MTQSTLPPRPSIATLLRRSDRADAPDGSDAAQAPVTDAAGYVISQPHDADDSPLPDTPAAAPALDAAPAPDALEFPAPVSDAPEPAAIVAAQSSARPQPSFVLPQHSAGATRREWFVLAALLITLVLQVVLADRARLAAQPGTRPLVEALCAALRCSLPAWREPAAFTMLSRDIRPVPGQAGALQVQASFRNDARWSQAWPVLHLTLSDADGRTIGEGRFQPSEYLGATSEATQLLVPGQSAQVAFRLREPAAATVAYNFDFQ